MRTGRALALIESGHSRADEVKQRVGINSKPDQENREYDQHASGAQRCPWNRSSLLWWRRVKRNNDAQVIEKAGDAGDDEGEDQRPGGGIRSSREHIEFTQKTHGRGNAGEREQRGGEDANDHRTIPNEAAAVLKIGGIPRGARDNGHKS